MSSVSRWAPFLAHLLRFFPLMRNPVEIDSVCQFTEHQGPKWSSVWVQRPYLGLTELNSPGDCRELNRSQWSLIWGS